MKKISEVCKLTGVTRRTLQEYDKIGLLKHTAETDGGYWLYDDHAIETLMVIHVFVEVGYKREEIKRILESENLEAEYDTLISILEEKKKRIEGMINLVKGLKKLLKLPAPVVKVLSKLDCVEICRKENFSDFLEQYVNNLSELEEEDYLHYVNFLYELVAIGLLKDKNIDSQDVRNCFKEFACSVWDLMTEDEEFSLTPEEFNSMSQEEFGNAVAEVCASFMDDPDMEILLDEQCGQGAADFIKKVFKHYRLKKEAVSKEEQTNG